MRNFLFYLFLIMFSTISFSQGIVVDTTALSVPQLVHNVLMNNSCSNETNLSFSSHRGIGQFSNTNPNFPFLTGIVIRNGIAKYSEGQYTGLNISSQVTTATDEDLQKISNNNGQTGPISDVAFIQFDFTPISNNFSFDFLFASNEYGEYQCNFSDVFTFLLTDLTSGVTSNLAVLPATTTPISVKNIRDNTYNSSCLSSNANLFLQYNVNDPATSAINMRGLTKLLKAKATVVPNRTYRIKMAVGDYIDSNYDSAVFINGASFSTTTDLGPDRIICQGEQTTLTCNLGSRFNYSWTFNGSPIVGQNSDSIVVSQPGKYGVNATLTNTGCAITDEVVVTSLPIKTPKNITVCNTNQSTYSFDLTKNDVVSLGLSATDYSVKYFVSLADATANSSEIPNNQLSTFSSTGNQTIYMKITHKTNDNLICNDIILFNLMVSAPIIASNPSDLIYCNTPTGKVNANLTTQKTAILNGQSETDFQIDFYLTLLDAQNNTNKIGTPNAYSVSSAQSPKVFWARMADLSNPTCFGLANFSVTIKPIPLVSTLLPVIECSSYTLPVIANGNYFTGPNGTGTPLQPGDILTIPGTYYIFNGPDANGCTNQSSFKVTLIDLLIFPDKACLKYTIPSTPAGNFYTSAGGLGTLLPAGSAITTNQTIYFYALVNGIPCEEKAINITIYPLPIIDKPSDVITCNSYTLPALTNGNYFTGTNGTGTALFAGNQITKTTTLYVYKKALPIDGGCKNENTFKINIVDTAVFQPLQICGSFILPAIPFGTYRTQPNGGGVVIPAGTSITTSQSVYYYANTTTTPNCTDNLKYTITILDLPLINQPVNRLECGNYTLPPLTNGNYYSSPNGVGPLFAGNIITKTKTIYVYAIGANGCSDQYSFKVEIRPLPPIDNFTNINTCSTFKLPFLRDGTYYTAPNGPHGTGTVIPFDTEISTTQTIYVYNEWSDLTSCRNDSYFVVEANGVEVGTFEDVSVCDSYILPSLTEGDYYSLPNGQGPTIPPGTAITTTKTIYVYKIKGTRLTCSDEDSFVVNVAATPIVIDQPDVQVCGSFILPPLAVGNYFSGSKGTGKAYFAGDKITTNETIYIYAGTNIATCFDEDLFNVTIYPLNNLTLTNGIICVDSATGNAIKPHDLKTGLDTIIFTVEWYLNGVLEGTGPDFSATKEGIYDVKIIKNTADAYNDCGYNPVTFEVIRSSPGIGKAIVKTNFEDSVDIEIEIVSGYGDYVYQMDGGTYQTHNTFYDVTSGAHTFVITDTKGGCGSFNLNAFVIKYPKYFTPNNDTYNDTWNIWDLVGQAKSTIYIYDRYGKFIKQIKPSGAGWDGTYNGLELPSTDYWFQVFYDVDGLEQEFKAHFSLRR
jgi:gliding motility-associated-like protein